MFDYKQTNAVAIAGFGKEGHAVYEFLQKNGFKHITVLDKNDLSDSELSCKTITGQMYLDKLGEYDIIIRSPGVPILHPALQEAIKRGVSVTSITEEFFNTTPSTILGITGSNGKTTTTELILHILKSAGLSVHRFGNDSIPDIEKMKNLTKHDIAVMELSSFQLQPLIHSPHIAVVTNITPNHLDYHQDFEEYRSAKLHIAEFQKPDDVWITNDTIREQFLGRKITVPDSDIAYFKDNILHLTHWNTSINTEELAFKTHTDTILMALAAVTPFKIDGDIIVNSLKSFRGVTHRLEFVGRIGKSNCYNDSSSTTPDSTVVAVLAFPPKTAFLMGGSTKNIPFEVLGSAIVKQGATPIVYGATALEIRDAIHAFDPQYEVYHETTMYDALARALKLEAPDIVLSPACASFDQFPNAKVRGARFTEAVAKLMNQ